MNYVKSFLEYKKGIEGSSAQTIKSYAHDLKLFTEFTKKPILAATEDDVVSWLKQWRNKRTKSRRIATLKSLFNWLEEREIIEKNFMKKIKTPKVGAGSPVKYSSMLTDEEMDRMRKACQNSLEKSILLLLHTSGIRASETFGMVVKNIDLGDCSAFLQARKKLDQGGPIKFSKEAAKAIRKYMDEHNIKSGSLYKFKYGRLRKMLKKIARRAEVPEDKVHPHIFRHMWASKLTEAGANMEFIMTYGGWSSERMPLRYSHLSRKSANKEYGKGFD
jgi:integrase/recombinase XerD